MKIKKFFLYFTILLSFLSFGSLSQYQQRYRIDDSVVVAYNPGGATDFQARLVTMMAAHPKKIIWVSLLLLLINLEQEVK